MVAVACALSLAYGCGSSDSSAANTPATPLPPDAGPGAEGAEDAGQVTDANGDPDAGPGANDAGQGSDANGSPDAGGTTCPAGTGMGVGHVVIVVQEGHTFDNYFGRYCTAATGSNPSCTSGPSCCEAGPATDPSGASPVTLDDAANAGHDRLSAQACEIVEINGGLMNEFVSGAATPNCSDARNFAYAPSALVQPYLDLASRSALADRYFQPIAGQAASNTLYLAAAKGVFIDDAYGPDAPGSQCALLGTRAFSGETTIADLLQNAGKSVNTYAEGWSAMVSAGATCPSAPADCTTNLATSPCVFDPADVPFLYYSQFNRSTTLVRDYTQLAADLAAGNLPNVAFVRSVGYHSEHAGSGTTISAGVQFVAGLVQAIEASCYKDSTLILLTWDQGGGFFDHVAPPAISTIDNQPYGTRVPLLAIGHYALSGAVSHTQMEHSSIVKFLEWNFLGGKTGQLSARDAVVNNLGSLLDPTKTSAPVPAN
jgi:phospholipase C